MNRMTGTQIANECESQSESDLDGVLIAAVMFVVFALALVGTHIGGLLP